MGPQGPQSGVRREAPWAESGSVVGEWLCGLRVAPWAENGSVVGEGLRGQRGALWSETQAPVVRLVRYSQGRFCLSQNVFFSKNPVFW